MPDLQETDKFSLRCVWCSYSLEPNPGVRSCPRCAGSLEVVYDYEQVRSLNARGIPTISKRLEGIWRYLPLLPVEGGSGLVTLGEGSTPYRRLERIGPELGVDLFVKDESRNPTCSFKDRKSAAAITKAVGQGFARVIAATAGNAGASVAAYAARAGLESYILAFQGISETKLAKLLAFNANVLLTSGSTGDVLEFSEKACKRFGMQNCSAASRYNPYVKEGAKTAVFEIFEQSGGTLPDWIILPLGGGGNISAYYKGLKELKELGLISSYPKLVGVQATGCQPVVDAFEKKIDPRNIPKVQNPKTIAHSILDDWAPDGDIALVSIEETRGLALGVSDEEIVSAMKSLSGTEAIYAEPSSATTLAALKKLVGDKRIDRSESVALIITGFGLNQPDATIANYEAPRKISLDLDEFGRALNRERTR